MMLPLILRIKVQNNQSRGVNLYIPMPLVYLLLLPLIVLIIPIWLIISLLSAGTSKGHMILNIVPALYCFLCATRGTEIDVIEKESIVILSIF